MARATTKSKTAAKGKKTDKLRSMSKAHQRYYTSSGERVPGVTTITGQLNKPALIHWAWKLGMDGIDYKTYRDAAADVGTLAHAMVVEHLGGPKVDLTQYSKNIIDLAENALLSFFEWEDSHKIEPVFLEKQLVSDRCRYGGTLDCYAKMDDGKYWLIDFKTGKAIYTEMIYQLAGYAGLLTENQQLVQGTRILRIGRDENEGFEDKIFELSDLKTAYRAFIALTKFYHLSRKIDGK